MHCRTTISLQLEPVKTFIAALICAWLVAFFPILSSTLIGLKSVDHGLQDLFRLYRTNRLKKLFFLQLPSSLPYFLSGFKFDSSISIARLCCILHLHYQHGQASNPQKP